MGYANEKSGNAIQFTCTGCAKQLRVNDLDAGKPAKYSHYETILHVPEFPGFTGGFAVPGSPKVNPAGSPKPYTLPVFEGLTRLAPIVGGEVGQRHVNVTEILRYAGEIWKSSSWFLLVITVALVII